MRNEEGKDDQKGRRTGRNYDLIYPPIDELWGACVIYPAIAPSCHAVMQSLK